jgi:hypothetical protein
MTETALHPDVTALRQMAAARVRRNSGRNPNNDPHDTHSTANWKRAYPLSRDPWDSETESHRKPVTPLHLSGRGVLEWTLPKKFSNAWRRRTRPRSSLRSSLTAKCE